MAKSNNAVLQAALEYHARGWCIIPVCAGTKEVAIRWKRYQKGRPDQRTIRYWFGNGKHGAVAVLLGEVSGNVVCRDFDDLTAYERWAAEHPDLARSLPTVETGRPGRHVYFRADADQVRQASTNGDAHIIDLGDGELRGGGICLLPPSPHPSGFIYRWLIPLCDELPKIDPIAAGLLFATEKAESSRAHRATRVNREHGEHTGQPKTIEAICSGDGCLNHTTPHDGSVVSVALCCTPEIDQAIGESVPSGPGKRNRQVLQLARALKAIPSLADADGKALKPIVRRWHELAKPFITTQAFEETWIDFLRAWPRVKFPKGSEPMQHIFEAAKSARVPTVALEYDQPALRLLVALCRELQARAGDAPFYLSCRTAGRLLGVDHSTAWRWLSVLLTSDGVLLEVTKGNQKTKRASRYHYLPGD